MAKKKQNEGEPVDKFQEALDKLNKTYGEGSVLTLTKKINTEYDVISSGSIGFDYITLGVGGFVKGKLYELRGWESSGKSTICGHAVAECQKKGGKVLYIDGEHAVDKDYFQALGVNIDDMLIAQPSSGEEGFNIALDLIETGEIDMVVIDSDSSLIPKKVLDGDVGDSSIGYKARLNSNAYPKLKSALSSHSVCMLVVSQYREKIGVMFGCLHGSTLVNFTDGRSIPIGKVVNQKIEGEVYAVDKFGNIQKRRILDWHHNGFVNKKEDFIHIQTTGLDGQNTVAVTVTPDHKLLTSEGWKEVKYVTVGEKLISRYKSIINQTAADFFYGTYVGDCSTTIRAKTTANLRFQDSKNPEYVKWKLSKLSKIIDFKKKEKHYESSFISEFQIIKSKYPNRNPLALFDNYSDLGLAVWIMDDGHLDIRQNRTRYTISIKRVKDEDLKIEIQKRIKDLLGLNCTLGKHNIQFNNDAGLEIAKRIHKYVPECMQYKLPEQFRGKYEDFELTYHEEFKTCEVEVHSIRFASEKQFRYKGKYDIAVEEDENYMAGGVLNGIVVHNSPTTTQGGHALKFYSDCIIEVSKTLAKEGDQAYGNITKVKTIKNKMSPPYKTTSFEIVYGKGIDRFAELMELGTEYEVLRKYGKHVTFNENKFEYSEFETLLGDNPELEEEIIKTILERIRNEKTTPENDGL